MNLRYGVSVWTFGGRGHAQDKLPRAVALSFNLPAPSTSCGAVNLGRLFSLAPTSPAVRLRPSHGWANLRQATAEPLGNRPDHVSGQVPSAPRRDHGGSSPSAQARHLCPRRNDLSMTLKGKKWGGNRKQRPLAHALDFGRRQPCMNRPSSQAGFGLGLHGMGLRAASVVLMAQDHQ